MERLAATVTKKVPRAAVSVQGMECNLSGLENKADALYRETGDAALVSAFVLNFVGRTLRGLRDGVRTSYGAMPILFAGGVMSCGRLKEMLADDAAYFAQPAFSSDNAAGTALLARYKFLRKEKNT